MAPEWNPIELAVDKLGLLRFSAHDCVRDRLAHHDSCAHSVLEDVKSGGTLPLPATVDVLAFHPAAHMLAAYRTGSATREDVVGAPDLLKNASSAIVDRLAAQRIAIIQDNGLLPRYETRGARIVVDETFPSCAESLDEMFSLVKERLGAGWLEFISIIRVVTVVKVADLTNNMPYFSGSWSTSFGAAHITKPKDPAILAETLTHEAAHTWLNLIEECQPLADGAWDDNIWISPWRGDPRPIGGIVHGVFVFSCVATVLTTYLNADPANESDESAIARRRAAYLVCQVEDGIAELRRTRCLQASGDWVCRTSEALLEFVAARVGDVELAKARDKVTERLQQKLEQWQRDGTPWRG